MLRSRNVNASSASKDYLSLSFLDSAVTAFGLEVDSCDYDCQEEEAEDERPLETQGPSLPRPPQKDGEDKGADAGAGENQSDERPGCPDGGAGVVGAGVDNAADTAAADDADDDDADDDDDDDDVGAEEEEGLPSGAVEVSLSQRQGSKAIKVYGRDVGAYTSLYAEGTHEFRAAETNRSARMLLIPLGPSACRMMVNFGDGRYPLPETVAEILKAVRKFMHGAIRDARAIKRKMEKSFQMAKVVQNRHFATTHFMKKLGMTEKDISSKDPASHCVDAEMMTRALQGYDIMSYAQACGFNYLCLTKLFPEEIMAFERWKEFTEKAKDVIGKKRKAARQRHKHDHERYGKGDDGGEGDCDEDNSDGENNGESDDDEVENITDAYAAAGDSAGTCTVGTTQQEDAEKKLEEYQQR